MSTNWVFLYWIIFANRRVAINAIIAERESAKNIAIDKTRINIFLLDEVRPSPLCRIRIKAVPKK